MSAYVFILKFLFLFGGSFEVLVSFWISLGVPRWYQKLAQGDRPPGMGASGLEINYKGQMRTAFPNLSVCSMLVDCQRGNWDPKRAPVPGAAVPGQRQRQKRCQQAPGPPSQLNPFSFTHGRSSLSPCFHPFSSKIRCCLHSFEAKSQQCLPAVRKLWASGGVLGRWARRIPMWGSPPAEMTCPSKQLLLGLLPDT